MLSQDQFNQYADQGYNRIPLQKKVLADLDTPLSTYLKLADQPYCYLLESVHGGEKWGRYSVIGLPCHQRLEVRGHDFSLIDHGHTVEHQHCDDPLAEIRRFQTRFRVPRMDDMPRFNGGLVGFFGYDVVRYIEPHLNTQPKPDPIDAPDILLLVSEQLVVFDNLSGCLFAISYIDPGEANAYVRGCARLDDIVVKLQRALPEQQYTRGPQATDEANLASSFPQAEFERAVDECQRYIRAGDIFQVALSQRMALPFEARPLDLYRALRTLNPSPYMYYLNLDHFHIVGSSPEILVRLEQDRVTIRPIAGTRRRGEDAAQDDALAADLLSDPKELAEHLMLIDLGRNDVGRVAEIGTVEVTEKMLIEYYSHVMHIVSNVTARIRPEFDAIDVLKATFPAGTLSGAPKVRAMEIIEQLEPEKRGVYSGAVGYIGWNGNMDTAIAIRTALIKNQTVYIQAGAGIVADSVAEREWQETLNKGRALLKAVAMAHAGLDQPLE